MNTSERDDAFASSRDIQRLTTSIDEQGYCIIEEALEPKVLRRVQSRIRNQARAERGVGV